MSLTAVIGLALTGKPSASDSDLENLAKERADVIKAYADSEALAEITKAGGTLDQSQVKAYIAEAAKLLPATNKAALEKAGETAVADVVKKLATALTISLDSTLEDAIAQAKRVTQEVDGLERERNEARSKLGEVERQLKAAQQDGGGNAELQKKIDKLGAELQEARDLYTTATAKRSEDAETHKKKIQSLEENHEKVVAELRGEIAGLETTIEHLKANKPVAEAEEAGKLVREAADLKALETQVGQIAALLLNAENIATGTSRDGGDLARASEITSAVGDARNKIGKLNNPPALTDKDEIATLEITAKKLIADAEKYKEDTDSANAKKIQDANAALAKAKKEAKEKLNVLKARVEAELQKPNANRDTAQDLINAITTKSGEVDKATTQADLGAVTSAFGALEKSVADYKAPAAVGTTTTPKNLIATKFTDDGKSVPVYPDEYGISWLDSTARAWIARGETVGSVGDIFKLQSAFIVNKTTPNNDKETASAERIRDAALVLSYGSLDAFNKAARSASAPAYIVASEADFSRAIDIMKGYVAVNAIAHRKYLHSIIAFASWQKTVPKSWPPVSTKFPAIPDGFWIYIKSLPALNVEGSRYATGYARISDNQKGSVVKYPSVTANVLSEWDKLLRSQAEGVKAAFRLIAGGIGDAADDYEPDLMGTDDARLVDLAAASDASPADQSSGPAWTPAKSARGAFDLFFGQ